VMITHKRTIVDGVAVESVILSPAPKRSMVEARAFIRAYNERRGVCTDKSSLAYWRDSIAGWRKRIAIEQAFIESDKSPRHELAVSIDDYRVWLRDAKRFYKHSRQYRYEAWQKEAAG
jgi:hypothetical protein